MVASVEQNNEFPLQQRWYRKKKIIIFAKLHLKKNTATIQILFDIRNIEEIELFEYIKWKI